jgi:hypothetical protein
MAHAELADNRQGIQRQYKEDVFGLSTRLALPPFGASAFARFLGATLRSLEMGQPEEPVGELHGAFEQFSSEGKKRNVPTGHDEHQAQQ